MAFDFAAWKREKRKDPVYRRNVVAVALRGECAALAVHAERGADYVGFYVVRRGGVAGKERADVALAYDAGKRRVAARVVCMGNSTVDIPLTPY